MPQNPSDPASRLLEAFDFAAELEQIRERHESEQRRLFLALLEVLDSFDRLLSERAPATEATAEAWQGSVRLIARQLEQALEGAGVTALLCVGERVDPQRHEIVEVVETTAAEDDTILEVLTRGYAWSGQPLRLPRVIVARHPKE